MRAVSSALLLAFVVGARAQAFGRFGYVPTTSFHGFKLSQEGVVADHPLADRLRFIRKMPEWRPLATSEFGQTIQLGPERFGEPSRISTSLLAPGISVYFPLGMRFKVGSTAAPYLTWPDGSGSNGVPTPNVQWIGLSFRDSQPAMVLGFPSGATSLTITGKPGAWEVRADSVAGWVRFGLPRGLRAEPTNSAASLGRLSEDIQSNAGFWTNMPPAVQHFTTEGDANGGGVVALWTFDRPGALIPQAVSLAPLGGYPIHLESKTERLVDDLALGEGPHDVCQTRYLKIGFPTRRIPVGRAVTVGTPGPPIGTVSPLDVASVVELAFENFMGGRDTQTRKAAEDAFSEFVAQASYTKEPFTDQELPFNAKGTGIDLAAAHAFLAQALTSGSRPSSDANALLTSIGWRRDWETWLPWIEDKDVRRRAAALAALTGCLCPESNRRVAGGMLQAGLSAERGMAIWRKRNKLSDKDETFLEPLLRLRIGLFALNQAREVGDPFIQTLLSPLRIYSDEAVTLSLKETDYTLSWTTLEAKAGVMTLASNTQLDLVAAENLPRFEVENLLGLSEIRYTPEVGGRCSFKLTLPDFMPRLPKMVLPPRYTESRR